MLISFRTWIVAAAALSVACGGTVSTTQSDGGTGGDSGQPVDAGHNDSATTTTEGCVDGGITFVFSTEAGTPVCAGSAFGCAGYSDWLTLTGPGGAPVQMGNPTCIDCNSCTGGCPPGPCIQPQPTTSLVGTLGWDGTVYATSTCGTQGEACGAAACAPAGHYVAEMCAYPAAANADAGPGSSACNEQAPTPHCVSVPFDWPLTSGARVVGSY